MLSFFKKKPAKGSRGFSYYNRENIVHHYNDLVVIMKPDAQQKYNTTKIIQYNTLNLSELTENNMVDTFDNPDFVIDKFEHLNFYKVYFYRHTVDKFNFLLQFHFFKEQFLFVSNNVTTAGPLTQAETDMFLQKLVDKYGFGFKTGEQRLTDFVVIDSLGNFIKVNDSVTLRMNYVNNPVENQELLSSRQNFEELPEEEDLDAQIGEFI